MMTHHKTKGKLWSLSPLPLLPPVGLKESKNKAPEDLSSLPGKMQLLILLLAFFLPPMAKAGE
jgi:hypothetical protein